MEQEKEVRVIQVQYRCDKCDIGYMKSEPYAARDIDCEHICNYCGDVKIFNRISYPYIKYEEI